MTKATTIRSSIAFDKKTGRFRSWYQHGYHDESGAFVPVGEPINDTHKSTQVELWEMAQGMGIFAPYPEENTSP